MIMYLNGLDELDQKIVQLLIKNARLSYSDIGKEVGISRVAVKARIQALEKKGLLKNIQQLSILKKSVALYLAILKLKHCQIHLLML